MFKVKIAVLGPSKSGKTCISNFLSDAIEKFARDYRPTQGVRILEFELTNINGKNVSAEIELWDCSGDIKYKHLWPVFLHKVDGCIFVYDPSGVNDAMELELLYDDFLNASDIEPTNCVIFANNKSKNKRMGKKLSNKFSKTSQLSIDVEDDIKNVKVHFDEFLIYLLEKSWHVKDQEENII